MSNKSHDRNPARILGALCLVSLGSLGCASPKPPGSSGAGDPTPSTSPSEEWVAVATFGAEDTAASKTISDALERQHIGVAIASSKGATVNVPANRSAEARRIIEELIVSGGLRASIAAQ